MSNYFIITYDEVDGFKGMNEVANGLEYTDRRIAELEKSGMVNIKKEKYNQEDYNK